MFCAPCSLVLKCVVYIRKIKLYRPYIYLRVDLSNLIQIPIKFLLVFVSNFLLLDQVDTFADDIFCIRYSTQFFVMSFLGCLTSSFYRFLILDALRCPRA